MSSNGDGDDSGPGTREVAHRLFAAEFDDASMEYSESDEERAPNYVVTPTGLRVNRLFAVGVLTEVESVNEDTVRGRAVDPTGAFVTYAGQYQPDELAFLDRTTPPAFVALTGKARTFQPDDSDVVYTSVRPESLSEVDADTRDRWTVSAAEATLGRLAVLAAALELDERGDALRARLEAAGAPEALAAGIPRALDHYGTTPAYVEAVRRLAVDALEVVAGEREEVRPLTTAPDAADPTEVGPLPDHGLDLDAAAAANVEEVTESPSTAAETATDDGSESAAEPADATESADEEPEPASATASTGGTATGETADELHSEGGDSGSTEPTPTDSDSTGTDSTGSASAGSESAEAEPMNAANDPESAESDPAATTPSTDSDGEDGPGDFQDTAGDLGDFEDAEPGDFEDAEPGDFEDALTEEERREVEAEHDVGFSTGSEVGEPGEAGIETPEPDTEPEGDDEVEPEIDDGPDGGAEPETDAEPEADAEADGTTPTDEPVDEGSTEDVDLEDAVVDLMDEFDDGDGADRDAVVSAAVERFGADESAADAAVQDALMSGKCYEPSEGTLKSI